MSLHRQRNLLRLSQLRRFCCDSGTSDHSHVSCHLHTNPTAAIPSRKGSLHCGCRPSADDSASERILTKKIFREEGRKDLSGSLQSRGADLHGGYGPEGPGRTRVGGGDPLESRLILLLGSLPPFCRCNRNNGFFTCCQDWNLKIEEVTGLLLQM